MSSNGTGGILEIFTELSQIELGSRNSKSNKYNTIFNYYSLIYLVSPQPLIIYNLYIINFNFGCICSLAPQHFPLQKIIKRSETEKVSSVISISFWQPFCLRQIINKNIQFSILGFGERFLYFKSLNFFCQCNQEKHDPTATSRACL